MTPDEIIEKYRETQLLIEIEEKKKMEIFEVYYPLKKKCHLNDHLEPEEKIKFFTSLIEMMDKIEESRRKISRLYGVNMKYENEIRNLQQK